jgi:hypothetical protein
LSNGRIAGYVGYQLHNPPRFVIDLQEVLEAKADLSKPLLVNTPQLKRIRVGLHSDKVRIVFDLPPHSATELRIISIDNGLQVILPQAQ